MSGKRELIVRKDTAILTGTLVKQSIGAMIASDVPIGTWLFGFDFTDPRHVVDVVRCDDDGTREWSQHTTEPFLIRTWAAKKIHLPKRQDRDETDSIRVILIDPEGDTLEFTSRGIVESLDLMRAMVGDGPFDPPIPALVSRKELGGGKQWLKLRPDLKDYIHVKK